VHICRTPVDVEVVIPAFNEAARLADTLRVTATFLAGQPWLSRIVVVDNGSVDDTAAVARRCCPTAEVIGCTRPGKGAAVRRGLLTSAATWVGFADADLSTPIETLADAVAHLERGADAVIASRHAPGAVLTRAQPAGRRLAGALFRLAVRGLVPGVHDTQCGFKFFRRDAVQFALTRCRVSDFAFDVELLRWIQRAGGRIVELPVCWTDDARSSLRPAKDGLAALRSVLSLRVG
jgi:glycosyltransferase involved in cell wall biosynthesis